MRLLLLAALLVGTPLSTAQHVNFYRMSSNGCATGVKSDTGFSAHVIRLMAHQCCPHLRGLQASCGEQATNEAR